MVEKPKKKQDKKVRPVKKEKKKKVDPFEMTPQEKLETNTHVFTTKLNKAKKYFQSTIVGITECVNEADEESTVQSEHSVKSSAKDLDKPKLS